jgi:hypothetical protein
MVHRGKKRMQALTTYWHIITYNLTTCTVYIINIALLRLRSNSWQWFSLLVFFYLQQLVTLWLQLSLLMSIVSVNLCWYLAVNKVVNCVLVVCAHHLAKATLRTPYIVSMSKECRQFWQSTYEIYVPSQICDILRHHMEHGTRQTTSTKIINEHEVSNRVGYRR